MMATLHQVMDALVLALLSQATSVLEQMELKVLATNLSVVMENYRVQTQKLVMMLTRLQVMDAMLHA